MGTLVFLLLFHFFADFVFQTSAQAAGKSVENLPLTNHVFVYSLTLSAPVLYLLSINARPMWWAPFIVLFIFVTHWITDYVTSRQSKKRFEKGDKHGGFIIIGFDQLLHTIQLWAVGGLIVDGI